jgi:lipopolysaccharide/colanic/teichoic acid biosynthesis glycosyltransferase
MADDREQALVRRATRLSGDTSIFERTRFDNYYMEYWSVWMDLAILARTVATVVSGGRPARRAGDTRAEDMS